MLYLLNFGSKTFNFKFNIMIFCAPQLERAERNYILASYNEKGKAVFAHLINIAKQNKFSINTMNFLESVELDYRINAGPAFDIRQVAAENFLVAIQQNQANFFIIGLEIVSLAKNVKPGFNPGDSNSGEHFKQSMEVVFNYIADTVNY